MVVRRANLRDADREAAVHGVRLHNMAVMHLSMQLPMPLPMPLALLMRTFDAFVDAEDDVDAGTC